MKIRCHNIILVCLPITAVLIYMSSSIFSASCNTKFITGDVKPQWHFFFQLNSKEKQQQVSSPGVENARRNLMAPVDPTAMAPPLREVSLWAALSAVQVHSHKPTSGVKKNVNEDDVPQSKY